ncbi:MAG: class F sortase [Nocardioides sp.]|uniref:class F sortase n=1 Tax=Nocardioides sp. TaxID=35761 RepID=UPI0039E49FD1
MATGSSAQAPVAGRLAAAGAALWTMAAVLAACLVVAGLVWPSNGQDADLPPGAPIRLKLPGVKTQAEVVPIRLEGTVLDPPRNYTEVGWWRASAKPGASHGQTVITGHTVHTGGGSLNRLGRLKEQQEVDVVTRRGTFQYQVDDVVVLSRAQLADRARRLFGQGHGQGRLVLVTCTDWNGSEYLSNVVVLAHRYGAIAKRG